MRRQRRGALRALVPALAVTLAVGACGSARAPAQGGRPSAALPVPSATGSAAQRAPASPAASPTPAGSPPATASPAPVVSPAPSPSAARVLTPGMSGADVTRLQRRLAALTYYPGPVDGRFGPATLEAVWAFQEVQGLSPTGDVGRATQQALAHPGLPAVLVPGGGSLRIEISLADEAWCFTVAAGSP